MPIGKDSIQKRVAKATPAAEAPEKVTETVATEIPAGEKPAPKKRAPAKKATPAVEEATAPAAEKKPAAKKSAPKAKKADSMTEPATAVMGNVAPETVEKVVGHAEKAPIEHVRIGQKMPTHLL